MVAVVPFRAGGELTPGTVSTWVAATSAPVSTLLADVSEFQPNVDDAAYLQWSKAMCIRAAYGDAHDDSAWYGGARRDALHAGGALFVGIYQFLVAGQDGTAQANALADLVGPLRKGEVLIADFEQGDKAMLKAWYTRMIQRGYGSMHLWTYTGLDFGQAQGVLPVDWIAAYGQAEPSSKHTLWQFTSQYQVPGVGTADCSVYHGTVEQLAALAYPGTTTPPPASYTPAPASPSVLIRSVGALVSFSWAAVKGQSAYHFQVQRYKDGFGWVESNDEYVSGIATSLTLAPRTRYRWRVAGGESDYIWTAWMEFDTA